MNIIIKHIKEQGGLQILLGGCVSVALGLGVKPFIPELAAFLMVVGGLAVFLGMITYPSGPNSYPFE